VPPTAGRLKRVSLTISPLHLLLPVGEVTGEVRILDKLSAAAILGFGKTSVDGGGTFHVIEVGTQANFYALGDFDHGLQLGLEALYLMLAGDSEGATGQGEGLSVGPFIGYKLATRIGFTLNGQVGGQMTFVRARAKDPLGETGSDSATELILLLNLNVGWSF